MNQNYDLVSELLAQGAFHWESDSIIAMLCTGAEFDSSAKTVADLAGQRVAVGRIEGRWLDGGLAMGLPVAFQKVSASTVFQVVVTQDVGNTNPNLLAFIDSNADDSPITVLRTGTLIVRPVLPAIPPDQRPPTLGVWMRLSA